MAIRRFETQLPHAEASHTKQSKTRQFSTQEGRAHPGLSRIQVQDHPDEIDTSHNKTQESIHMGSYAPGPILPGPIASLCKSVSAPHHSCYSTSPLSDSPAIYLLPLHVAPHGERHGGCRATTRQWKVTSRSYIMILFLKFYVF